jgi:hypothetical protein
LVVRTVRGRGSSSFLFIFYVLPFIVLGFTYFFCVLVVYFLSHLVTALYSTFHSDVPSSAHVIFTMQHRCAMTSHSYSFAIDSQFLNQILSFLPPTSLM